MTDPTAHELDELERLVAFADRIDAGESPSESAGLEWHELVADIRALAARLQGDPGLLREALERYEADPVNANDRPESWAALSDLLDAVRSALAATPAEPQHYSGERPCPYEQRFEEHMRAVHATPAEPEAIDVERLLKAIENVAVRAYPGMDRLGGIAYTTDGADTGALPLGDIAAEYARLSNPAQRETPEGAAGGR